jgi:hypothetical protein
MIYLCVRQCVARKSNLDKIKALLDENPNLTAREIGEKLGVLPSSVIRLWGPLFPEGRKPYPLGIEAPNRLTDKQRARVCRDHFEAGLSQNQCAAKHGISQPGVSYLLNKWWPKNCHRFRKGCE